MAKSGIERFAEITRKQLRSGTYRSTQALEQAIREYLEVYNEDPKPFIWTKTANPRIAPNLLCQD